MGVTRCFPVQLVQINTMLLFWTRSPSASSLVFAFQASADAIHDDVPLGQGIEALARYKDGTIRPVRAYFGVIDYLQEYTMRKRMERAAKGFMADKQGLSVANPEFYRNRFVEFMLSVFVADNADHEE